MNRQEEIERIMRLACHMTDDQIRECIGKALDLAYQEGYRQREEDRAEATALALHESKNL